MTLSQPDGFLAMAPAGKGRGVLVLHPWWGLNDTMKTVCSQLASAGFTAFAPDLYHGKLATTIQEAESLSSALFNGKGARTDVANAVSFLSERAERGDQDLAVVGFSLGAFYALDVSAADPDHIRHAVLFYGTRPADYITSRAEYLGHFAEKD